MVARSARTVLQAVMGMMRPEKADAAKRAQFLLGHRVLGGLSLFLGLFCVVSTRPSSTESRATRFSFTYRASKRERERERNGV